MTHLAGITPRHFPLFGLAPTGAGFSLVENDAGDAPIAAVPFGGPAGAGRPCNGFAVLHAVAAVPVHGRTIGP